MTGPAEPGARPPTGAPPPPPSDSPYASVHVARRLGNTVKTLLSLHVDIAREEAEADLKRLAVVAALLGGAVSFGAVSALTLGALIILAVQRVTGLPALESAAIALGIYGVILISLALAAALLLRRPFLPRTRALVRRTVESLTQDDPGDRPAAEA